MGFACKKSAINQMARKEGISQLQYKFWSSVGTLKDDRDLIRCDLLYVGETLSC